MDPTIKAIIEARKILNKGPITGEWAYMTKEAFLEFGGTEEAWAMIPGDDGAKLIKG